MNYKKKNVNVLKDRILRFLKNSYCTYKVAWNINIFKGVHFKQASIFLGLHANIKNDRNREFLGKKKISTTLPQYNKHRRIEKPEEHFNQLKFPKYLFHLYPFRCVNNVLTICSKKNEKM